MSDLSLKAEVYLKYDDYITIEFNGISGTARIDINEYTSAPYNILVSLEDIPKLIDVLQKLLVNMTAYQERERKENAQSDQKG